MTWLVLAFGAAVLFGLSDIVAKYLLKTEDPYLVAFGRMVFAAPFLLPILLFIDIPRMTPIFWKSIMIIAPLEIIAAFSYMKGVQISPISLSVPFMAFTPVFSLFTGFLFLNEAPTAFGILGVVIVVAGAYVLHIKNLRDGFLAPFKAIFREKGSMFVLATALIYAVTAVLGKKALLETSPMFMAAFYTPLVAVLTLPVAAGLSKNIKQIEHPGLLVLLGILFAASSVFHFLAISQANVAYMISVKRMSIIVSTVVAYFAFKEENLANHLLGALLMVAGVIVIASLG